MEFLFSGMTDHATIDGEEFFGYILVRLSHTILGEFEYFSIAKYRNMCFFISEIVGVASVSEEHMRKTIDRDIILWLEHIDHFFGVFFFCMSTSVDL